MEDTVYRAGIDHDLIILGAIQIENRVFDLEIDAPGPGAASLETVDEENAWLWLSLVFARQLILRRLSPLQLHNMGSLIGFSIQYNAYP